MSDDKSDVQKSGVEAAQTAPAGVIPELRIQPSGTARFPGVTIASGFGNAVPEFGAGTVRFSSPAGVTMASGELSTPFGNTGFVNLSTRVDEGFRKVGKEISALEEEVAAKAREIQSLQRGTEEWKRKVEELDKKITNLKKQIEFRHLLTRVTPAANEALLNDSSPLRDWFLSKPACEAFVMSIDIRRSTELMLKARTPEDFAGFVTDLCSHLRGAILENLGVFDKFTGDGILAFFPLEFSGESAGIRAIRAADACHKIFGDHYRQNRKRFTAVLKNTGLGIGIDFGNVKIVNVGDELTVVGPPVVYACRMGSAYAGTTLLNQPAFEHVFERFSAYCTFGESEVDFKHEGKMIAYTVLPNGKPCDVALPSWLSEPAKSELK